MPDDPHNTRTCSKTIFKGLFLVCRMRRPMTPEPFALPGEFDLAPESWKQQLQRAVDARALRISFRGDLMFTAFDTNRKIMAVSKDIDTKIIDEYRRSFQDSVDMMKDLMEAVAQNTGAMRWNCAASSWTGMSAIPTRTTPLWSTRRPMTQYTPGCGASAVLVCRCR